MTSVQEPKSSLTYLAFVPFSTIRFSTLESIRYMKIVAIGAKIMINDAIKRARIPLKLHVF